MHRWSLLDEAREQKIYADYAEMPDQVTAIFNPWFRDGETKDMLRKDLLDMVGKRFTFTKHKERLFWVCNERQELSKIKKEWMDCIEPAASNAQA